MRAFNVPATYRPFIEGQIRLACAEVQRDIDRREDEDARIQQMATVPDQFLDKGAAGTLTILVGVGDTETADVTILTLAGAMRA